MTCELDVGTSVDRDSVLRRLVELQYERNDVDFHRATFRVRGITVEVFPGVRGRHRGADSNGGATRSRR